MPTPVETPYRSIGTGPETDSSTTTPETLFTARPTTLALAWVATADLTPRAQRVGRAIADHVRIAPAPKKWRHIKIGDLVTWVGINQLALELGCCTLTVKRGIAELIDAGLDRRRTMRTNTYVFPIVERVQPPRPRVPQPPRRQRQAVTPPVPPPVTLPVTPKEPREDPHDRNRREVPSRAPARDPRIASDAQVEFAISLGLENGVLKPDQIDEARARWSTSDWASITLRIGRLRKRQEPRFIPSPPPVVPLDLLAVREQQLPLDGDVIGEAAAAAKAQADTIREVLTGSMAARMTAAAVQKLQARLAGLEAQIGRRGEEGADEQGTAIKPVLYLRNGC